MIIEPIKASQKTAYNSVVSHPLQSYEWGEFREKLGTKVLRFGFFDSKRDNIHSGIQLTLHPIPHTPFTIGYIPKGDLPSRELLATLILIGKKEHTVFFQFEPNSPYADKTDFLLQSLSLKPSVHPLFTQYTFLLDLTQSEEDLLSHMHPKTRYNIKVAAKHNVLVTEENSPDSFKTYLQLSQETTKRQGFYAHTLHYHTLMWQTLQATQNQNSKKNEKQSIDANTLRAHLFIARYNNIPLVAWIVFTFHDTLYYPYGASSSLHRESMASNGMMWEVILWGKKMGLKKFDMWGALGENPSTKDPWYGFHHFKQGYGPTLIKFVGSYDYITNPLLYSGYTVADTIRWSILKAKTRF